VVTITNIYKNVKIILFVLDKIEFIPIIESWVKKKPMKFKSQKLLTGEIS